MKPAPMVVQRRFYVFWKAIYLASSQRRSNFDVDAALIARRHSVTTRDILPFCTGSERRRPITAKMEAFELPFKIFDLFVGH